MKDIPFSVKANGRKVARYWHFDVNSCAIFFEEGEMIRPRSLVTLISTMIKYQKIRLELESYCSKNRNKIEEIRQKIFQKNGRISPHTTDERSIIFIIISYLTSEK